MTEVTLIEIMARGSGDEAGGWVAGFTVLFSIVALLYWHLEHCKIKMLQAQMRGIMRWISPPTGPAR